MNCLPKPPWSQLGRKIESKVRSALFEFAMICSDSPIGIALSGGKDSLTLLAILKAIQGKGFPNFPLLAFHVGGPYSCGASIHPKLLEKYCSQLSVPLFSLEPKPKMPTSCYPCSRERRTLIFEAAKKEGAETIAFGHHRDDLVQTLLLNLLHKGEFAATLPKIRMHAYEVTLIRPLIHVTEEEIRNFAINHGFARTACQCPVGQNSMRRKVDDLMNEWEDYFPNIRTNLASAAHNYGSKKALDL